MKKIVTILPLCILAFICCKAQRNEPSGFIPKGYVAFGTYFGDLNKDGQEDCVLIIKKTEKDKIVINRFDEKVDRNRRGMIVLFKKGNNYQLADKNYDCFSSEHEDGGVYFPPELWIEIKNNKLYVHYGHGRYGYWEYTFRFQNANFELIGYDESNGGVVIRRETSINFLTKKKLIRENINENAEGGDEIFKETWHNITMSKRIKLSEIKDFDALDMYHY